MSVKKHYTPAFKLQIVVESLQRDTTVEAVCKKFGLSSSMVYRWRRMFWLCGPQIFASKRDLQVQNLVAGSTLNP
jgi:transposase-like protein